MVCSGYIAKNLPLQPWRYLSEIAEGLARLGLDVTVITETQRGAQGRAKVVSVKDVRLPRRGNTELEAALDHLDPDVCLWHLGLTSALSFDPARLRHPTYGVFTSPIYSLRDLTGLGAKHLFAARDYAAIHLAGASIPRDLVRRMLAPLAGVITESRHNAQSLEVLGLPKAALHHVPPGIDDHFRTPLPEPCTTDAFTLLYMGSPLPIRGVFDLVDAVASARRTHPNLRLRILSRGSGEYAPYERRLRNKLGALKLAETVSLRSGFLERTELRDELSRAHLVALPFQIVPSDVPLAVLENMALGKPVLGTRTDSLTEYLGDGCGYLARPGDARSLARTILEAAQHPNRYDEVRERARLRATTIPSWPDVASRVAELIGTKAVSPV